MRSLYFWAGLAGAAFLFWPRRRTTPDEDPSESYAPGDILPKFHEEASTAPAQGFLSFFNLTESYNRFLSWIRTPVDGDAVPLEEREAFAALVEERAPDRDVSEMGTLDMAHRVAVRDLAQQFINDGVDQVEAWNRARLELGV